MRGSRFIADLGGTADVDSAQAFRDDRRAEFSDASHHCFAFIVGHGASVTEGKSDDGEPSGTAGAPMLAVLRGSGLGDLTVVVTRYFGGTKLGTGGLVRAYTAATQAVLAMAQPIEKVHWVAIRIRTPYPMYESIGRLLSEHGAEVLDERFEAAVTLTARIPQGEVDGLEAAVAERSAGRIGVERR